MKKILLLTCMLLQLFCLDGMAMQTADMRAMGFPDFSSPRISALSFLQDDDVKYQAELIPVNDIKKGAGKDTPLFFNGQEAQFQLKLTKIEGDNHQDIENPEEDGWILEWELNGDKDFKPKSEGDGVYSFIVKHASSDDPQTFSIKCNLEHEGIDNVPSSKTFYVTKCNKPSVVFGDSIRYVNLSENDNSVKLEVKKDGGTDYWTYEWLDENRNSISTKSSCTIDYDPEKDLKRNITVNVKNSRTEGAEWYDTTFTYQVIFWEKYELTLAMNQKPERKEWNVLSGTKVDIEYLLKNVTQDNLVQNPEGDEEGWKADWNRDPQPEKVGQTSYKFTPIYEGTDEFSNETLKLTLTNKEKSPELTDSLLFHVYPEPSIETNKKVVESGNPYDADGEVKLKVIPKGGFKDGWNYSWKEGEESTDSIGKTYTVKFDGAFTRTITVTATNVGPEGELWLNETFKETFIVQFKQPGEYEIELSSEKKHVVEGKETLISVQLKRVGEQTEEPDWVKDGWKPTWDSDAVINNEDGTFTFIPNYNGGDVPEKQTLTLTLENKNYGYKTAPSKTITFNVYPEPKATQEPDSVITATIGRPVELIILTEGGYDDGWSFEWTDGEKKEKNETGIYSLEFDGKNREREVSVKVNNFGPEEDQWYEKDFTFNVTFEENPYTIEFEPIKGGMDVLDGTEIEVTFSLLENGENVEDQKGWTLVLKPNDRVKPTGPNSCIFTAKYDADKHFDSYTVDILELTFENEKLKAFATGSLKFNVYPKPSVETEPENREINANIGEDVPLKVKATGGNPDGWTYCWMENGEEIENDKGDEGEFTVTYDGTKKTRTIQVIVSNLAPNGTDYWYGPEGRPDTLQFTINYNNPYTIKLETEPAGKLNVLEGDFVKTNFRLQYEGNDIPLDDEEWKIELTPENKYVLNEDGSGSFDYIAEYKGEEGKPFSQTVTVTLRKDGIDPITESIEFMVYQKPDAKKDPASNPITAYTNAGVTLKVDYHGGNPDGWSFEWTENGNDLMEDKNSSEYLAEYENYPSRTIRVRVVNKSPDGLENWFDEDYEFVIEFKEPLSYIVELLGNDNDENVLDGNDVQLSFTLYKVDNETRSEVKDLDGWTLTWDPEDLIQEKGGKYYFTAQYQGDDESWKQTITLTLQNDELEVSDNATFVIWPQPVIADGQGWLDVAEFKDLNNPLNKLQKGIRAGNKLGLPEETPDISINHEWEGYEWKYVWSVDGKEYDDVVDIPTKSDDQYSLEITCIAQYTNGKDVMWEKVVGTRTLNVFKMPPTPTYFVQKGNGTSNTWIISGFKKESSKDRLAVGTYKTNGGLTEVKAISESINATITENGTGWFIMEGHRDAKDLCLYTVRDYGDNVVITSDILPVNLTSVVKWDGSTYENRGILPQSAPSVTGVYSIDGVKTSSMVRGLNIIRLEDGTVRKVFKK